MIDFQSFLLMLLYIQLTRFLFYLIAAFIYKIDESRARGSRFRDWAMLILLFLAMYPREKAMMIGWFKDLTGGRKC